MINTLVGHHIRAGVQLIMPINSFAANYMHGIIGRS